MMEGTNLLEAHSRSHRARHSVDMGLQRGENAADDDVVHHTSVDATLL